MPTLEEDLDTLDMSLASWGFRRDDPPREALTRIRAALGELDKMRRFAPICLSCGNKCEPERWVYFTPTCYACLPPPEQLKVIPSQAERARQSRKGEEPSK